MDKKGLGKVLNLARRVCEDSGERFTEKREQIFKILIKAKSSLSAYEIVDLYNQYSDAKMPPMSVYRILEFLEKKNLVHECFFVFLSSFGFLSFWELWPLGLWSLGHLGLCAIGP